MELRNGSLTERFERHAKGDVMHRVRVADSRDHVDVATTIVGEIGDRTARNEGFRETPCEALQLEATRIAAKYAVELFVLTQHAKNLGLEYELKDGVLEFVDSSLPFEEKLAAKGQSD